MLYSTVPRGPSGGHTSAFAHNSPHGRGFDELPQSNTTSQFTIKYGTLGL